MKVSELLSKYDGNLSLEYEFRDANSYAPVPELYYRMRDIPQRIKDADVEAWSVSDRTAHAAFKIYILIIS